MSGDDRQVLCFAPGRYFSFVVFIYGEEPRDLLGALFRDEEGKWRFHYRFRYYASGDHGGQPFSDEDEKSFYEMKDRTDHSEDEMRAVVLGVLDQIVAAGMNDTVDLVELRSADPVANWAKLRARDWCHTVVIPILPEAERL